MRAIVAAIHGIMTGQTDASWPDRFDAWIAQRDPEIHVVKKEYVAAPLPRWNCSVRNPRIARGLASEIELLADSMNGLSWKESPLPADLVGRPQQRRSYRATDSEEAD